MTRDAVRRSRRESPSYTVVMKSRDDEVFTVHDPLDAEFLEIADEFQLAAQEILAESPRRSRRRARR